MCLCGWKLILNRIAHSYFFQKLVYGHRTFRCNLGELIRYLLFTPLGPCLCWWTFRPRGYHQPSSQYFGVDMNINYVVIFINFLFTKLWIFRKTKDFLIPGVDYLSRIWHNFLEFWIPNALQLCIFLVYNYFDMSVTDESYVDETRVWRTKL